MSELKREGLPTVRITSPTGLGRDTRVLIDGRELRGITRLSLTVLPEGWVKLTVDMLAIDGAVLDLPADVTVNLTPWPPPVESDAEPSEVPA